MTGQCEAVLDGVSHEQEQEQTRHKAKNAEEDWIVGQEPRQQDDAHTSSSNSSRRHVARGSLSDSAHGATFPQR